MPPPPVPRVRYLFLLEGPLQPRLRLAHRPRGHVHRPAAPAQRVSWSPQTEAPGTQEPRWERSLRQLAKLAAPPGPVRYWLREPSGAPVPAPSAHALASSRGGELKVITTSRDPLSQGPLCSESIVSPHDSGNGLGAGASRPVTCDRAGGLKDSSEVSGRRCREFRREKLMRKGGRKKRSFSFKLSAPEAFIRRQVQAVAQMQ